MRELIETAGLKEPVFESDTFFRVIFYRDPGYSLKGDKTTQKSTQKTTQKSTQKILDIISQNSSITRAEIAQAIGMSEGGVKKQLKQLQAKGILKRIGPDKGGHWEIVAKQLESNRHNLDTKRNYKN